MLRELHIPIYFHYLISDNDENHILLFSGKSMEEVTISLLICSKSLNIATEVTAYCGKQRSGNRKIEADAAFLI